MYHIYILSSRTKICPRFPTFSTKESFVGNLPSLIKLVTRRLAVLIYLWHADSAEVETQVNAVIHMHFDCIRQTSGTNSTSWLRCHKPPYLLPLSLSLPLSFSFACVSFYRGVNYSIPIPDVRRFRLIVDILQMRRLQSRKKKKERRKKL